MPVKAHYHIKSPNKNGANGNNFDIIFTILVKTFQSLAEFRNTRFILFGR